jgi:CubicO group peptidase (beta-lactamase class C family)
MSIKDNIHKYIPNYPTEGHEITIENLMSHTSGIARNFPDRRKLNKLRKSSTTVDEMLTLFAKEPMQFSPGEKMRYSNIGYVLLGKIIEVVSGQSYAEFIEINIFKKLGMNDSQYDGLQIVPNRATGYHRTRYGYENADWVDSSWRYAAGGLVSTVNDLALWYHSLASGKLISLNSYRQMIEPFKLNDGRQSHYALGLNNFEIHKNKVIAHNGRTSGFSTSAVYFPEQDSYIAVLSNERPSDPQKLLLLLSAEMLGISYPEFKSAKVENSQLKKMMGKYQIGQDSVRRLFEEEGLVYSQRDDGLPYEVIPMSDNSFYFKGSLSYFVIEKDDNDNQVMLYYSSLSEIPERAVKL